MKERRLVIFDSPIGWIGICHLDMVLERVRIGYDNADALCSKFRKSAIGPSQPNGKEKRLIKVFQNYFDGRTVDFMKVEIDTAGLTPFQQSVVQACRQIPSGVTVSYGELAASVGRPGAARAVGTVMRKNAFPIIVPCHRVVAASGLGGYSGPKGVSTKVDLQAVEKVTVTG